MGSDYAPLHYTVIIPALNESASIAKALHSVQSAAVPPVEVLVVDGGSTDDTAEQARRMGAEVISCERGRGRQLNAGWRAARGEWCLFLHSDSQLPPRYDARIGDALHRAALRDRRRGIVGALLRPHGGWVAARPGRGAASSAAPCAPGCAENRGVSKGLTEAGPAAAERPLDPWKTQCGAKASGDSACSDAGSPITPAGGLRAAAEPGGGGSDGNARGVCGSNTMMTGRGDCGAAGPRGPEGCCAGASGCGATPACGGLQTRRGPSPTRPWAVPRGEVPPLGPRSADCPVASLPAEGPIWGAFATIRTDLRSPLLRCVLSCGVELRTRLLGRPYGDQAIFVRRDALEACGGFKEWPLLEDLELVTRLGKERRPVIVDAAVSTSGRRWQAVGFWATTALNQAILAAYALGVPPDRLAQWYRAAGRRAATAAARTEQAAAASKLPAAVTVLAAGQAPAA